MEMNDRFIENSRDVFRTSLGPTLLDVRDAVATDDTLAPIPRRDMLSALNRIETHLAKPLITIPATASAVRDVFSSLNPVTMGNRTARPKDCRTANRKPTTPQDAIISNSGKNSVNLARIPHRHISPHAYFVDIK